MSKCHRDWKALCWKRKASTLRCQWAQVIMGVTNLKIRLTSTHFSGNGSRKTYLCPVLGKAHAEIHHDKCLSELQHPNGKTLPISFIGIVPYIKHIPFGGSEPLVIKMLAKKYGFLPNFVPERAYDVTKVNGTTYGMVHRVRFVKNSRKNKRHLNVHLSGIDQTYRNWNWPN